MRGVTLDGKDAIVLGAFSNRSKNQRRGFSLDIPIGRQPDFGLLILPIPQNEIRALLEGPEERFRGFLHGIHGHFPANVVDDIHGDDIMDDMIFFRIKTDITGIPFQ